MNLQFIFQVIDQTPAPGNKASISDISVTVNGVKQTIINPASGSACSTLFLNTQLPQNGVIIERNTRRVAAPHTIILDSKTIVANLTNVQTLGITYIRRGNITIYEDPIGSDSYRSTCNMVPDTLFDE